MGRPSKGSVLKRQREAEKRQRRERKAALKRERRENKNNDQPPTPEGETPQDTDVAPNTQD